MKIIIFPASYYPVLGGIQEVAYRLSKEFKKKGHDTKVITQRYPRNLKKKEILDNIPIYRILFTNIFPSVYTFKQLLKYITGLFFAPIALLNLVFFLNKEKPDIIYLHFIGIGSLYLLGCRFLKKFKLIVSLHGADVETLPNQSKFNLWLFRKICSNADFVAGCSKHILEKAKKICPEIKKKSMVIHNGIGLNEFGERKPYTNSRSYIFAAGRFVHIKGFDVLIKAFDCLIKKSHKIDLIIAGEGIELHSHKKLAKNLGLRWVEALDDLAFHDPKIIYWGKASREEMKSLLAGSEMVVVPSRKEAFGLIVLEAMASGSPVVASKVGGIAEILSEGNGLLVKPDNEFALCDAIEKLLTSKKLRSELINRGIKRAKEFSWSDVADRYLSLAKVA